MKYRLFILLSGALLVAMIIMVQSSCYYDKSDQLYPFSTTCDTTTVTYSKVVQPILNTQCYSCHSTANAPGFAIGIDLEDYNTLKTYASNGKLVCDIEHDGGCNAMPLTGSKIDQCYISEITSWVVTGAPNN